MYSNILYLASLVASALALVNSSTSDPKVLLQQGIDAIGGSENIARVESVKYVGSHTYRTRTMMQTYGLTGSDRGVASLGYQNITYSFDGPSLRQRQDVKHDLDSYYATFARAELNPMEFTAITHGGENGFAAFPVGGTNLFDINASPRGYVDGLLSAYWILRAEMQSPFLLTTILRNDNFTYRLEELWTSEKLPAVYDDTLQVSVLFDPKTNLPYAVRSFEMHDIFGPVTSDLLLTRYTTVDGIKFPTNFKTMYNGGNIIMNNDISQVQVNPTLPEDYFDGPSNTTGIETPRRSEIQDFSEIGEAFGVYAWAGPWALTLNDIVARQPFPDLLGLWVLDIGTADLTYTQAILVLEDAVVVFDSPRHQSLLVLQWVEQTLGRKVTHVWPTHHHHDHSSGLKDYARYGAKAIVPDTAQFYYKNIPGLEFESFGIGEPFVLKGEKVQARIIHMEASMHAADHTFAVILPARPTLNSSVALFDADHAPNNIVVKTDDILSIDDILLIEMMRALIDARVAETAIMINAHIPMAPVFPYYDRVALRSPGYSPLDFKYL